MHKKFTALATLLALGSLPLQSYVPSTSHARVGQLEESVNHIGEHVYTSRHYMFSSKVPLGPVAKKRIAELFEDTYAAGDALAKVVPIPRVQAYRKGGHFHANLYASTRDFEANGGIEGSAGTYRTHRAIPTKWLSRAEDDRPPLKERMLVRDYVALPFDSLGLNRRGRLVESDVDSHVVVHEAIHQLMVLNNLPEWAEEGFAEYLSSLPMNQPRINFRQAHAVLVQRAKQSYYQRQLDCHFSLYQFFMMSQQQMYDLMDDGDVDTYGLAGMLISFFLHMDGKRGVKALRAYMNARLRQSASAAADIRHLFAPYGGVAGLQHAFQSAWRVYGIEMRFR